MSKTLSSRERTNGNSRRPAAVPTKSPNLAAEAAEMEAKLLELRKAMELERAKREGKGSEGSHWRAGAPGYKPLASRSKSGTPLPPVQHASGGMETAPPSTASSHVQRWTADMDARGTLGVAASSGRASASSSRPDSGGLAMQRPGQLLSHRPSLTRMEPLPPPQGVCPASREPPTQSSDTPALADGTFDEAESHTSFLDALNEWREANRAQKQPDTQQAAPATAAMGPPSSSSTRLTFTDNTSQGQEHSSGIDITNSSSASGMQTETRGPSRPDSASKPTSYFNRLLLNSASRQAGQAACGSFSAGPSAFSSANPSTSGLPMSTLDSTAGAAGTSGFTGSGRLWVPGEIMTRRSHQSLPPLTSPNECQVYAVETAMTSPAQSASGTAVRHRGLDILEELERLEMKQYQAQQYDSDEEWAALLSPRQHGQQNSKRQHHDQIVVTTQQGMGLTKGVRLPDAILLPEPDSDDAGDEGEGNSTR